MVRMRKIALFLYTYLMDICMPLQTLRRVPDNIFTGLTRRYLNRFRAQWREKLH